MANILYLECASGISGDMAAAALLDLGADREVLERALDSLAVDGFKVEISRVNKSGLDICDFNVVLNASHENHDHDMEYLHGHHHEGGHNHEGGGHAHEHRALADIADIIEKADITQNAKNIALKIFTIIAEAEALAHGLPVDEVHFHEVGAVDSIVDIVAVAVCVDNLGISEVIVPEISEGKGFVRCQHGRLPIPVPAVVNIAASCGLRFNRLNIQGELVTPTGAAIAAALKTADSLPESYIIERTGMGAGKREYEIPSILRAMLIKASAETKDLIYKLETNIDDCTGEALGFVMDRLLEAGARDVHYTPVYMKKNRPAYQLNVICSRNDIKSLEDIIFRETTTIGIRRMPMERTVLNREVIDAETSIGKARVKLCRLEAGLRRYPEYESVAELAIKNGLSYGEAYDIIKEECRGRFDGEL